MDNPRIEEIKIRDLIQQKIRDALQENSLRISICLLDYYLTGLNIEENSILLKICLDSVQFTILGIYGPLIPI